MTYYLGHKFILTEFYYYCEVCDVKVWFISGCDDSVYTINHGDQEFSFLKEKYKLTCNEQQIKKLLE